MMQKTIYFFRAKTNEKRGILVLSEMHLRKLKSFSDGKIGCTFLSDILKKSY